ncbi:hypothetical protein BKA69DRAFT_1055651 [Paraphysoderma sedebokerense]|nr:hypothetical protein BKA69DRAFT_1055651 [Paraphysoderma sedebokerense]
MRKETAQHLAPLLDIPDPLSYARSLFTLLLEYEYEITRENTLKRMFKKALPSKNSTSPDKSSSFQISFEQTGVYQYLETPNVPFELCAPDVFHDLTDTLSDIYIKISELMASHKSIDPDSMAKYSDLILKIDAKLQKVLTNARRDFDPVVQKLFADEISKIKLVTPDTSSI